MEDNIKEKVLLKRMDIYGLVGENVSHSLSPLIHNAVFKKAGINAGYELFSISGSEVEGFLKSAYLKGIRGLNVTFPYKEKVIPFLSTLRSQPGFADLIGAVNTLRVEKESLIGYNTDGDGFIDAVNLCSEKEGVKLEFKNSRCLILGAGGAAKAVAVSLLKRGAPCLSIFDSDLKKASTLVEYLRFKFKDQQIDQEQDVGEGFSLEAVDLLVNATPVGMKFDDKPIFPPGLLHKKLLVYDCVYNPEGRQTTLLVEAARNIGAIAFDGIYMLVGQAIRSEKIWFGDRIDEKKAFDVSLQALRAKGYKL